MVTNSLEGASFSVRICRTLVTKVSEPLGPLSINCRISLLFMPVIELDIDSYQISDFRIVHCTFNCT